MIIRKLKSLVRIILKFIKQSFASYFAASQFQALARSTENPFFVIVMPGGLHILKHFFRYVPANIQCVLILNGLTKWEKKWLQSRYSNQYIVNLDATLPHGQVIDLVIDNYKKPFGMIDSDCFVFNPSLFEEIQFIPNGMMLNAVFCDINEQLYLEIPQTYFLFFNPTIISFVKRKYKVNSNQIYYKKIRKMVRNQLLTIGIDANHPPESYKRVFDTFRLIVLLGLIEGHEVNFIRKYPAVSKPNNEIFHVGAVYFNNNTTLLNGFKGSYFWRLCLELSGDKTLIEHYKAIFGHLSSQELLAQNEVFADYQSTKLYISFIKQILSGNTSN